MTDIIGPEFEAGIRSLLQERFGLSQFREGQLDILQSVFQDQDAMAVMPTGGGKSLCFQLPALYRDGIVIVISPLIALMRDQVRSLQALGIPAGCLYSGQKISEKQEVFNCLRQSKNFLLYLSPERVQKPAFAQWLKSQRVSLFAVDESHCVSQWGHDFRPDYQRLDLLREVRPEVPILALTATATPRVLSDISRHLKLKRPHRHIHGFYRPNLYYQVETCDHELGKSAYLGQSLTQTPEGRVIIYCGTRKQTEALVGELGEEFSGMAYYHAGLSTEERNQIQRDYEEGKVRILAATNAFGMGIDHPDVRLVVHYQMPANIESLYQEMGRAGRDGRDSTCLLLYSKKDKGLHSYFITKSDGPRDHINYRWDALGAITQFAEGAECRHAGILTYFKDARRIDSCGHCDTCDAQSERRIKEPANLDSLVSPPKKKPRKVLVDEPLSNEDKLRYEWLKEWRRTYAQEHDVPAFMVFSNKTLRDLSQKAPVSLNELEKVYGMGPHKIEHLGELILEQLALLGCP